MVSQVIEADLEDRARTAVQAMDGMVELLENQVPGWSPDAQHMAALLRVLFDATKKAIPTYAGQYHGPRCNDD